MMKNAAWPAFSFTESLSPPEGWKTDCAILSTYSADLVVVVTSLLALAGCDLDSRRTGSRVELVKAIETLRGRVCVLAQASRLAIPNSSRPILKLLDRFMKTVDVDERVSSWHPKAALIRFQNVEDSSDFHWRLWLGSRNLTRALNWDAGLVLTSRSDGKGQHIEGLAATGESLAARANLADFPARKLARELAKLTWECPPGSAVHRVTLLGPGLAKGFPKPSSDTDRMFIVCPFLDAQTVREGSLWGHAKTRRTLVSTAMELQRLLQEDATAFAEYDDLRIQSFPDLPSEVSDMRDEESHSGAESLDDEELEPTGLHAKLYFAAKGARRQLWLGSANATRRGWQGRNYEIVAELSIARDVSDSIEEFVATCDRFNPNTIPSIPDEDESALEEVRKLLSANWALRQRVGDGQMEIIASDPPPLADPAIELEVGAFGGSWNSWPISLDRIVVPGAHKWQRSDFVQIRIMRGDRMCSWLQIAPCEPPLDVERDHALIAQYLDPRTFLLWLRSMLADEPARAAGGDWDAEGPIWNNTPNNGVPAVDAGIMPTVEEILRSWARDSDAFAAADKRVKTYLTELERRAVEGGASADVELLKTFRQTWDTFASELQ
jgi:hypothetical protein